jgi:glucosamine--fructose-6-phosphate aminotransferase (isomerizing)
MSQLEDFLSQINSLSEMIGPCVAGLEPATRTILTTPEIYGLREIILTGSGDSYFAAAAAAPLLRTLTGLPVQAMVSMEAARYALPAASIGEGRARGTLVIAVSYSGEAARLVEAARRWAGHGAITLAVTASPGARLAQAVERRVDTSVPPGAPGPGVRTYVASLIGLYLFSIRVAEVLMRITMDEANRLRAALAGTADAIRGLDDRIQAPVKDFATTWGGASSLDLVGSGYSFATAAYAAAKFVEAAGTHATAQDTEEFFHLNFFADRPAESPTVIFAPAKAAFASRAGELFGALKQLGRPSLVITDRAGFGQGLSEIVLPEVDEAFVPIIQAVPAALLAAYAAHTRAAVHYRGHAGRWSGAQGADLVRNSRIEPVMEG